MESNTRGKQAAFAGVNVVISDLGGKDGNIACSNYLLLLTQALV